MTDAPLTNELNCPDCRSDTSGRCVRHRYRFSMRRVYAIFAEQTRKQSRLYRMMGRAYG